MGSLHCQRIQLPSKNLSKAFHCVKYLALARYSFVHVFGHEVPGIGIVQLVHVFGREVPGIGKVMLAPVSSCSRTCSSDKIERDVAH